MQGTAVLDAGRFTLCPTKRKMSSRILVGLLRPPVPPTLGNEEARCWSLYVGIGQLPDLLRFGL